MEKQEQINTFISDKDFIADKETIKNIELPKVDLLDPEDKLYKFGFKDGQEKALKILQKKYENQIELSPIGTQRYLEGYRDGVEEAINEYIEEKPKTK